MAYELQRVVKRQPHSCTLLACDCGVLVTGGAQSDECEPREEVLLPTNLGGILGVNAQLERLEKLLWILESSDEAEDGLTAGWAFEVTR
jgi:hypothetical protein